MPGARLWLYTNFHCNLACDYCCVASSPQAPRRELGAERIARLVSEAAAWGVRELYLTGGEPFLLADIDTIVRACVDALPTTVLTNGMVFRGRGRRALESMPRKGLALQISLDSATADLHDMHRGAGSWQKAVDGIRLALSLGFRVRVAATVAAPAPRQLDDFHRFLDELGIARRRSGDPADRRGGARNQRGCPDPRDARAGGDRHRRRRVLAPRRRDRPERSGQLPDRTIDARPRRDCQVVRRAMGESIHGRRTVPLRMNVFDVSTLSAGLRACRPRSPG